MLRIRINHIDTDLGSEKIHNISGSTELWFGSGTRQNDRYGSGTRQRRIQYQENLIFCFQWFLLDLDPHHLVQIRIQPNFWYWAGSRKMIRFRRSRIRITAVICIPLCTFFTWICITKKVAKTKNTSFFFFLYCIFFSPFVFTLKLTFFWIYS